jgi:hypothetical protein
MLKSLLHYSALQRNVDAIKLDLEDSKVLDRSDILFGYELEVEGFVANEAFEDNLRGGPWHIVGDGSLRGNHAMELVSRPMGGRLGVRALRSICKQLNTQRDLFSYRCSTHLHMNMLNMGLKSLPTMGLLSILCDNMLYVAGGGGRNVNFNCRPISLVSEHVEGIAAYLGNPAKYEWQLKKENRYLGTNWNSLVKFGTVEFRHFPGTSDPKSLIYWTNLLCRMYTAAENSSPEALMEKCADPKTLGTFVFGQFYKRLESARAAEDWAETMETAESYMRSLHEPEFRDRTTLHGFLEAEYMI